MTGAPPCALAPAPRRKITLLICFYLRRTTIERQRTRAEYSPLSPRFKPRGSAARSGWAMPAPIPFALDARFQTPALTGAVGHEFAVNPLRFMTSLAEKLFHLLGDYSPDHRIVGNAEFAQ